MSEGRWSINWSRAVLATSWVQTTGTLAEPDMLGAAACQVRWGNEITFSDKHVGPQPRESDTREKSILYLPLPSFAIGLAVLLVQGAGWCWKGESAANSNVLDPAHHWANHGSSRVKIGAFQKIQKCKQVLAGTSMLPLSSSREKMSFPSPLPYSPEYILVCTLQNITHCC